MNCSMCATPNFQQKCYRPFSSISVPYRINKNLITSVDKTNIKFFCPTDNSEFSKTSPFLLQKYCLFRIRRTYMPSAEYLTHWLLKDKRNTGASSCLVYFDMMNLMKECLLYAICSLISRLVNN